MSLAEGVHSPLPLGPLQTPGEGSIGSVSPQGSCSSSDGGALTGASGVGRSKRPASSAGKPFIRILEIS